MLSVMVLLLSIRVVHAEEIPEETGTEIEVTQDEVEMPAAVIHMRAWAGTKVTVETGENSPEPDRNEFTCVGNRELDFITIRLDEPGNYEYRLVLGPETYVIRVCGVYEDTEDGEAFVARTAIYNADGTKTDEPTYTPPSDTPFGIADIEGGWFAAFVSLVCVLTGFALVLILKRKEEKAK